MKLTVKNCELGERGLEIMKKIFSISFVIPLVWVSVSVTLYCWSSLGKV